MLKKSWIAALALTSATAAFAAPAFSSKGQKAGTYKYGMAGCGLGSLVVEGPDRQEDKVFQLVAWAINAYIGFQVSAITTGTSNCEGPGSGIALIERETYIETNLSSLEKEAARGEGLHLEALSTILGCPLEGFSAFSQRQHSEIFADRDAKAIAARVVEGATREMSCDRAG